MTYGFTREDLLTSSPGPPTLREGFFCGRTFLWLAVLPVFSQHGQLFPTPRRIALLVVIQSTEGPFLCPSPHLLPPPFVPHNPPKAMFLGFGHFGLTVYPRGFHPPFLGSSRINRVTRYEGSPFGDLPSSPFCACVPSNFFGSCFVALHLLGLRAFFSEFLGKWDH